MEVLVEAAGSEKLALLAAESPLVVFGDLQHRKRWLAHRVTVELEGARVPPGALQHKEAGQDPLTSSV